MYLSIKVEHAAVGAITVVVGRPSLDALLCLFQNNTYGAKYRISGCVCSSPRTKYKYAQVRSETTNNASFSGACGACSGSLSIIVPTSIAGGAGCRAIEFIFQLGVVCTQQAASQNRRRDGASLEQKEQSVCVYRSNMRSGALNNADQSPVREGFDHIFCPQRK